MTKTIMLIHGAWLNAVSRGALKARYEARGYKVVAPSWPFYNGQKQSPSLTEFKEFPERSHWTCMDPGWEEAADYALAWVEKNGRSGRPARAA